MPSLRPPPRPGFWWSPLDPIVLLATIGLTSFASSRLGPVGGLIPIVSGHYFLFCNVVRLRPWREAIWAVAMVWITGVLVVGVGSLHWAPVLLCVLPVTAALVVSEVADPGYRGVGAAWVRRLRAKGETLADVPTTPSGRSGPSGGHPPPP